MIMMPTNEKTYIKFLNSFKFERKYTYKLFNNNAMCNLLLILSRNVVIFIQKINA